jgi:hypothetical protein
MKPNNSGLFQGEMGKAINFEYGKIEKLWGLLNRNHSDGNIEFNFENGNIDSKTGSNGVPRGVGGGG